MILPALISSKHWKLHRDAKELCSFQKPFLPKLLEVVGVGSWSSDKASLSSPILLIVGLVGVCQIKLQIIIITALVAAW